MNKIIKELKQLQALVDITNYLAEHNFTYDEANEFIHMLDDEISTSRDCHEYETADDWFNKCSCCDIANNVIVPLNKVDIKKVMFENDFNFNGS